MATRRASTTGTGAAARPAAEWAAPRDPTGSGGAGGSTDDRRQRDPLRRGDAAAEPLRHLPPNPPINGAPMPLLTYANLTAPSIANRGADVRAARADAHAGQPVTDAAAARTRRATAAEIDGDEQLDQRQISDGHLHADDDGRWGRHRRGWGGRGRSNRRRWRRWGDGGRIALRCSGGLHDPLHDLPRGDADQRRADAAGHAGNLIAPSFANAAQTFAQRAVMRMQGNPSQMPPAPGTPPTATEITDGEQLGARGLSRAAPAERRRRRRRPIR